MNYKLLFTAVVALMSMMFVSCSDDDATFLNEIRVSQSYVAIDKNGGEVSIDIAATDSWSNGSKFLHVLAKLAMAQSLSRQKPTKVVASANS